MKIFKIDKIVKKIKIEIAFDILEFEENQKHLHT